MEAVLDDSRSLSSHAPTNSPEKLRLHIYDKGTNKKFLIDSGLVVSIIPIKYLRHKLKKTNLILFAANSTPIHTYGTISITLDLNLRRSFRWPFVVADVQEAIIGADFLTHHNLLIDLTNRQLIDSITGLTTKGRAIKTNCHSVSTVDPTMPHADLLQEFINITKPSTTITPKKLDFAHRIITNGSSPVTERYRKLAGEKAVAAKAEIEHLLKNNIIRPSSSPWSSPIHMVRKKNNSWRLCGDYRKLNAITVPDKYAPPLIHSLFPLLHRKTIFSIIDLKRAYHQIPMHQDDIQKTAITTPWGLYEYTVMSFGLKNTTQTFQRFIDAVFRGLDFIFVYIDD